MAARLRKAFRYPSDGDDGDNNSDASSTPSVLDEQEQETLITTLAAQNASRNASFRRQLYALPTLSAVPFLLRLFLPATKAAAAPPGLLLSLLPALGLSSLAATLYLLHRLPATETGFAALDGRRGGGGGGGGRAAGGSGTGTGAGIGAGLTGIGRGGTLGQSSPRVGGLLGQQQLAREPSPLQRHLPVLNIVLSALALLTGLLGQAKTSSTSSSGGGVSPALLGALPGVVYAVVVAAKVVMAGVDPERELSGLKYGYKGA
ncbi:hypothetical protein VTK26DRAFT_3056 [Humicola hyalothermophila]